jgi:hypothetical protein
MTDTSKSPSKNMKKPPFRLAIQSRISKRILTLSLLLASAISASAWTDQLNTIGSGWMIDEEPGAESYSGVWAGTWGTNTIQFALINYPGSTPMKKTRFEIRRALTPINKSTPINGVMKVKYDIPTLADGGFANGGGWIMQNMGWNYRTDPWGNPLSTTNYPGGFYAVLLAIGCWNGQLQLCVYNNWTYNASTLRYEHLTSPVIRNIAPGRDVRGTPFELVVSAKYSTGSTGYAEAYIVGDSGSGRVGRYDGVTYPIALPNGNIQFKCGTYSTSPTVFHSKVGLDWVYLQWPSGGYN